MSAPAHAPTRTRSRGELRALAAEGSALGDLGADEAVRWLVERVGTNIAVASSMADAVLPHLVSSQVPGVDVVFLDTGYHFLETIVARDEVATRLPVRVVDVRPDLTVQEQDRVHGKDLFATDPGRCCELRKMVPLARTLEGYDAWLSGVRREESGGAQTHP